MAVADRRAALLEIGWRCSPTGHPTRSGWRTSRAPPASAPACSTTISASKRQFHVAVVAAAYEQLRAATEPDPQLPPDERLRASLAGFLDHVRENATGWAWLLRGASGADAELVARATRCARRDATACSATSRTAIPAARVAVRGWIGFIEAAAVSWLQQPAVGQDQVID